MARILCIWELGDDLGHIGKFSQVSQALVNRGHDVFFAAKDLSRVEFFYWDNRTRFVQSPVWLGRMKKLISTNSLAEIFFYKGFNQSENLRPFVKAWLSLVETIKPDLIIFDHAPTALLATSGCNIPKMILSNCYVSPPPGSPPIDLRPWEEKESGFIEAIHVRVTDTINQVAKSLGLPILNNLSDLYKVDSTIFPSYAELDPYLNYRQDALYVGELGSPRLPQIPEWGLASLKVFAYLKHGQEQADAVLQCLGRSGAHTRCFYAGAPDDLCAKYQSSILTLSNKPYDLTSGLQQADVIISHAGLGMVSASLSAGKPMILIPTQLEQRHTANAIEKLRAGVSILKDDTVETINAKLKSFFSDPIYRENAKFFAYSNRHFSPDKAMQIICDTCDSLV